MINSDYLVDRRNGLKLNINESEIADAAATSKNKAKAAINYILQKGFLPTQLGEEETKKICAEVISEIGASSLKDMGKVMGELKKKHADEIDFAKAGPLIKELLSS